MTTGLRAGHKELGKDRPFPFVPHLFCFKINCSNADSWFQGIYAQEHTGHGQSSKLHAGVPLSENQMKPHYAPSSVTFYKTANC